MNYLASPPLVVAYALAGSMDVDITTEPLGTGSDGQPVYLRDLWPSAAEVQEVIEPSIASEMYTRDYADVFAGDERWTSLSTPTGDTFAWDAESTYVRKPPYFDGMQREPAPVTDVTGARVLAKLGDSVTTDHISPAGAIKTDSPAGSYLAEHGVERRDFNSYGSRRGNHEVMIRGPRRQHPAAQPAGAGHRGRDDPQPADRRADDDLRRRGGVRGGRAPAANGAGRQGVRLRVPPATGAAKGTALLGVRAVLAESYERIHRSNLIGMGVLPPAVRGGADGRVSLGLTGEETFDVVGVEAMNNGDDVPRTVTVRGGRPGASRGRSCGSTPPARPTYYRHGGIMPYVLRSLL